MFAGFWKVWSQTLGGRLPILALCISWEGMGASGQQPPFQPPLQLGQSNGERGRAPTCLSPLDCPLSTQQNTSCGIQAA